MLTIEIKKQHKELCNGNGSRATGDPGQRRNNYFLSLTNNLVPLTRFLFTSLLLSPLTARGPHPRLILSPFLLFSPLADPFRFFSSFSLSLTRLFRLLLFSPPILTFESIEYISIPLSSRIRCDHTGKGGGFWPSSLSWLASRTLPTPLEATRASSSLSKETRGRSSMRESPPPPHSTASPLPQPLGYKKGPLLTLRTIHSKYLLHLSS